VPQHGKAGTAPCKTKDVERGSAGTPSTTTTSRCKSTTQRHRRRHTSSSNGPLQTFSSTGTGVVKTAETAETADATMLLVLSVEEAVHLHGMGMVPTATATATATMITEPRHQLRLKS
jgi:hypothetical protein